MTECEVRKQLALLGFHDVNESVIQTYVQRVHVYEKGQQPPSLLHTHHSQPRSLSTNSYQNDHLCSHHRHNNNAVQTSKIKTNNNMINNDSTSYYSALYPPLHSHAHPHFQQNMPSVCSSSAYLTPMSALANHHIITEFESDCDLSFNCEKKMYRSFSPNFDSDGCCTGAVTADNTSSSLSPPIFGAQSQTLAQPMKINVTIHGNVHDDCQQIGNRTHSKSNVRNHGKRNSSNGSSSRRYNEKSHRYANGNGSKTKLLKHHSKSRSQRNSGKRMSYASSVSTRNGSGHSNGLYSNITSLSNAECKKRRDRGGFKTSDPVSLFHQFKQTWSQDKFLNKKSTVQSFSQSLATKYQPWK